jgi:hypothetical protein
MANQFGLGFDSTKKQKEDKPTNPTIQTRGIGSPSPLSPTPIYDATTNAIAGAMKILPVEARTWFRGVVPPLMDTILKRPRPKSEDQYPIGGENFTDSDIKNIDSAINSARTVGTKKDIKDFLDFTLQYLQDEGLPEKDVVDYNKQKNKGLVSYGNYFGVPKDIVTSNNPIMDTLGSFGYEVLPDGKIRVFDKYDSRNERLEKHLNKLNKEKETQDPLSVLWKQLKFSIKEDYLNRLKKEPSFLKELFTKPHSFFADLAQVIMNVVAENESTAKPIDFIYDPKTLEKYPTPIDSITGRRPKFGDMSKQNKKAEEVKKSAKNKNTKGKGKV